jgi:hypothetical protein
MRPSTRAISVPGNVKTNIVLRSQIGLQLWKIWTLRWKLIVETIREHIKISHEESPGYFELKKHKLRFDKGCWQLLNKRKEAKLQWSQDPCELNRDKVRLEASRHFRNKKREYLKGKINELAMNNKNKNIRDLYRGINEFKRDYQPRNNLVKG